ncbi:MAG: DUF4157 domain-containing protein [Myxococcales bacterium]|nr:DUF4157 domain-containing protein [Myxococcales bacterium]
MTEFTKRPTQAAFAEMQSSGPPSAEQVPSFEPTPTTHSYSEGTSQRGLQPDANAAAALFSHWGDEPVAAVQMKKKSGRTPHGAAGIGTALPCRDELQGDFETGVESSGVQAHQGRPAAAAVPAAETSGTPLPDSLQRKFSDSLGADLSGVRIHTDTRSAETADKLDARAFAHGKNVHFGFGQYDPTTSAGEMLLAHEVAHTVQQGTSSSSAVQAKSMTEPGDACEREADTAAEAMVAGQPAIVGAGQTGAKIARKTKGEEMTDKASQWLNMEKQLKDEVDKLRSAIREIKQGKSIVFNRPAGLRGLAKAATLVPSVKLATLRETWNWLCDHYKEAATDTFKEKENSLFSSLKSPLTQLSADYPKSQTKYWLKNTPPQVADILYQAADADMPVDQLFAYASKEGLIDYIRSRLGLGQKDEATAAQLNGMPINEPISGFSYLGLDDYKDELHHKNEPLSKFLPKGFDDSKVADEVRVNEQGREVHSGTFPDLLMAIQALAAMLKRRRTLFRKDAQHFGYATPTTDELVYWTYVYFNAGENGGRAQLEKYSPTKSKADKRKLSDWITKGEYDHAIKLLQSYRMAKEMKIF